MRYLKIVVLSFLAFSTAKSVAQKSTSEKILGCWILKKIEYNTKLDFSEELIKEAQNTVVCFDAKGKFTSTKADSTPITGTYKVLEDGKTITQKRDISDGSVDEDAEFEFPDDTHLIFKLEFGSMQFERK